MHIQQHFLSFENGIKMNKKTNSKNENNFGLKAMLLKEKKSDSKRHTDAEKKIIKR